MHDDGTPEPHWQNLYPELCRRFPEIVERIKQRDANLSYLIMGELVYWLAEKEMTPELSQRVVSLAGWCEDEPRTESAADDPLTIFTVAFYEELFRHETTRKLIPKLSSREELVANESYLKSWVGPEAYDAVLAAFGRAG